MGAVSHTVKIIFFFFRLKDLVLYFDIVRTVCAIKRFILFWYYSNIFFFSNKFLFSQSIFKFKYQLTSYKLKIINFPDKLFYCTEPLIILYIYFSQNVYEPHLYKLWNTVIQKCIQNSFAKLMYFIYFDYNISFNILSTSKSFISFFVRT